MINVRKPAGPTSHDVVAEIRRIFGQKRVGHAGTLDPMAAGVLLVCLGKATRVVEYLMGLSKEYRARMVLGRTTDTQDATGEVTSERDASGVTRQMLEEAAARFVGEIEQVPPMISALKHQGKPLYKLAREGKSIERAPRPVTIHSIDVTDFSSTPPEAELVVRCSSGTYIRTLCADIGEVLGCGAYMSALERTAVGPFRVDDAVTLDDLRGATDPGSYLMDINKAVAHLPPAVVSSTDDLTRLLNGGEVSAETDAGAGSVVRVLGPAGDLLAIGTLVQARPGARVRPGKVLASPETGVL